MARPGDAFSVEVDVPLSGDVDLASILVDVPPYATLKGMFCARYAAAIEGPWEEIAEELDAPPKGGKYTAFDDYPLSDYLRLMDRAARDRFPRSSTREAYRLLGRGVVDVFAASTLGKVTFALIRDPAQALARYPDITSVLTRGAIRGAAVHGEREVSLRFPRFVGAVEASLGCFEALVLMFDARPSVKVVVEPDGAARFDVRWTGA